MNISIGIKVKEMVSGRKPRLLAYAAAAVLLLCYQLSLNREVPLFRGWTALEWETLNGCADNGVPLQLAPGEKAIGTFTADGRKHYYCRSKVFAGSGTALGVEYYRPASKAEPNAFLMLIDARDGRTLKSWPLAEFPAVSPGVSGWREILLRLDFDGTGRDFFLLLRSKGGTRQNFALRNRLNFYQHNATLHRLQRAAAKYRPVLILALAAVLAVLLLMIPTPPGARWPALLLLFFALAAGVHFRVPVFFYWDEWHVLQRFQELGLPGVVYTHNEHFLPLFFATFFAESRLLGVHYHAYIFVSLALHTLNTWVLFHLLAALFGARHKKPALVLSMLFLVSGLHAETLEWAFEQSLLLSQLCILAALLITLRYMTEGGALRLLAVAALVCASPLFFGNGFSVVPQVILVGLYATVWKKGELSVRSAVLRAAGLAAVSLSSAGAAALLYLSHAQGAGHGIAQADPWSNLTQVFRYFASGSQAGTILRGLGLFPTLNPNAAPEAFFAWKKLIPFLSAAPGEEIVFFAWVGLGVSLLLAVFAGCLKEGRSRLPLWLLGQLLIATCFILPSFGRWALGVEQSLSLRYHYPTVAWLCLIVFPLIAGLTTRFSSSSRGLLAAVKGAALLLLTAHLACQLRLSSRLEHFTASGFDNRLAVQKIIAWRESESTPPGFEPLFPQSVTPGRGPDDIYRVWRYLRGKELGR